MINGYSTYMPPHVATCLTATRYNEAHAPILHDSMSEIYTMPESAPRKLTGQGMHPPLNLSGLSSPLLGAAALMVGEEPGWLFMALGVVREMCECAAGG